jgi:hypothetical protein
MLPAVASAPADPRGSRHPGPITPPSPSTATTLSISDLYRSAARTLLNILLHFPGIFFLLTNRQLHCFFRTFFPVLCTVPRSNMGTRQLTPKPADIDKAAMPSKSHDDRADVGRDQLTMSRL